MFVCVACCCFGAHLHKQEPYCSPVLRSVCVCVCVSFAVCVCPDVVKATQGQLESDCITVAGADPVILIEAHA